MRVYRKIVSVSLAGLVLSVSSLFAAQPSMASSTSQPTSACQPAAASQGTSPSVQLVTDATMKSALTDQVKALVDGKRVIVRADRSDLVWTKAKIYRGEVKGQDVAIVNIPLDSSRFSLMSGLTVVLANGKLDNYGEIQLSKSEHSTFFLKVWSNGKLTKSSDSRIGWASDDELRQPEASLKAAGHHTEGWGEKVACVAAVLGVSWKVASLITALCGGACASSATNPVSPAVCATCVGAYVTFGGTALGFVVGCFKL